MNYLEYKQHLKENELVESFDSLEHVLNATIQSDNIKKLKRLSDKELSVYEVYGANPLEAIPYYQEQINLEINQAIRKAYTKTFATSIFGTLEEFDKMIDEMRIAIRPTVTKVRVFGEQ